MLSLLKRPARKAPEAAVAAQFDEDLLSRALEALAAANPLPDLAGLPQAMAAQLQAMAEANGQRDQAWLKRTVDQSMRTSEAMAATAMITSEVRVTHQHAEGMAAAVEELTASINQIASTAADVANGMNAAERDMHKGASAAADAGRASARIMNDFDDMQRSAEALTGTSEQISGFVGAIDALAQQTNLLALNATIEAARAGEAGRGFSIVASEVKALSNQTSKVTEDMRAQIQKLVDCVTTLQANVDAVRGRVQDSITHSQVAADRIHAVESLVTDNARNMGMIATVISQQNEAIAELAQGTVETANHSQAAASYADEVIDAVTAGELTIQDAFRELEGCKIPNYVLYRAKSDHVLWKKRLADMLSGLKALSARELTDHHSCRLGKWYDNVTDQDLKSHPAYSALRAPHEQVHVCGRRAAELYANGDLAGARVAFDEMNQASRLVLLGLDRLISG